MFLLFAVLWGALLCLILCAPYGYYPVLLAALGASILLLFVFKKLFKPLRLYICLLSILCFIGAYFMSSYIIFKPVSNKLPPAQNLSSQKKAVIFYCEGEMEKYTPYYSGCFFEDAPTFLKPVYAFNIKMIYRRIGVNPKNNDLIKVAKEVKDSLLNYKPYYFYIAFSGYTPSINDAVSSALLDGCSDITVINYTCNPSIRDTILKKVNSDYIYSKKINLKISDPVYTHKMFAESISTRIINMAINFDGIMLIGDKDQTSDSIISLLASSGYKEDFIVVGKDIKHSIEYLKKKGAKNILYVNLVDAGSGINGEYKMPLAFQKYAGEIKLTGIKSWGYDKNLVKASIEVFLKAE